MYCIEIYYWKYPIWDAACNFVRSKLPVNTVPVFSVVKTEEFYPQLTKLWFWCQFYQLMKAFWTQYIFKKKTAIGDPKLQWQRCKHQQSHGVKALKRGQAEFRQKFVEQSENHTGFHLCAAHLWLDLIKQKYTDRAFFSPSFILCIISISKRSFFSSLSQDSN